MSKDFANPAAGAGLDDISRAAVRAAGAMTSEAAFLAKEEPFIAGASSDEPLTEATTILQNYAAATILNLDANNDALTSQAQEAYKEAYCSADLSTVVAAAEEKEKKKEDAQNALEAQAEEREQRMEERRALSERDKEILRNQYTDIGGKKISVLDYVEAMDKKLDDWDNTFSDMVAAGYAKENESEKKKYELMRLRDLWARTDLSPEQKKIEQQKMVASGKISQETVDYNESKLMQENVKNSAEASSDVVQRAGSERYTSVAEGKKDFSVTGEEPVKSVNAPSLFTTSASAGIEAGVNLTQTYNAKANVVDLEGQKPIAKAEITNAMNVTSMSSSMGFG